MIVREMLTLLGFQADDTGAQKHDERLRQSQKRAEEVTSRMSAAFARAGAAVDRSLDRMDHGLSGVQSKVQGFADSLGGIAGALGGGLAFAGFAEITSRMSDFQSRLNNVAEGTAETGATLMEKLRESANTTYQAFDGVVDGFIAMNPALNELGLGLKEQIDLATAMADSLTVASVKGEQAARIMMWMNRTLAAGEMSGEAFANIMEADADVLDKLRQSLGMTVAEFQEFGRAGKISANMVVDYYKTAAPELRRQSENMTTTIADAMVIFRNNFDAFIHGTSEATGAANAFARAILWFAERPAIAGGAAIAALGAGMLAIAAQAASAAIGFARGAVLIVKWLRTIRMAQLAANAAMLLNPYLWIGAAVVAAIAGITLAVQDLYTWINGGDSVLGRWLGDWSAFSTRISDEWSAAWENVKLGFANIGTEIGRAASAVGDWFAPLLEPVSAAMASVFGDGGSLSTSIVAAFPILVVLALWRKLWGLLPEAARDKAATLFEPLKGAWSAVIDWIGEKWDGLWGRIGGAISGAVDRVRSAFSGASAEAQKYAPRAGAYGIPQAAGAEGADSADPTIPQYARGTPNAARGVALVGEEGPELVRFRGGEEVVPTDRTESFLAQLASRANGLRDRAAEFAPRVAAGVAAGAAAFAPLASPALAAAVEPSGMPVLARPERGGLTIGTINAPTSVTIERGAIPEGVNEERVAEILAERVDGNIRRVLVSEFASVENHFTEME